MNTNNVKKYAPKARKAFIEAMSKQAAKYGITKKKIEPAEQKGDLVLIGDRPFPALVIKPRERLVKRIEQQGFDQVMEHVAYSWFNRLCAIRYMERKGFLDHGRRVLSAADGSAGVPQILEECLDIELHSLDESLDQAKVRELKLDGTKDEELYRELLLAQCHSLHQAMPFLFEAVADESELLLPENLTKTDSLIRELVASVPDEDWDHIEIIGWLYQFYISEKKDQVMGKVVKSEDIPAATQLFTPNWIVQYLVQNSVGRQWLQTYPDSPLKEKMPYYIEPAEQTPEVQAQLAAINPKELKPEELSATDICCGSGHILIEAYKLFKFIYEERGYRTRDIPQLILENNIFGHDIDDRAGQLAGFALMMLAREDDRRIFSRSAAAGGKLRLNVLSLQESSNVNLPSLWRSLNLTGEWQSGTSQGLFEEEQQNLSAFAADNRYQLLQKTLERFKQAKTFGSLIDVPHEDYEGLKELFATLCELERDGDSMQKAAAAQLMPYVHQAVLLAQKYDAVVANPPYMGSKGMNAHLKEFAKKEYPNSKSDLFAVFMERAFQLLKPIGFNAQVNMQSWMFLSSYERLRSNLLEDHTVVTMAHLGPRAFSQISGEVVQTTAWVVGCCRTNGYRPVIYRLVDGNEEEKRNTLLTRGNEFTNVTQKEFQKIPGSPIAYWLDSNAIGAFESSKLGDVGKTRRGLQTGNKDKYIRYWFECNSNDIEMSSGTQESYKISSKRWHRFNNGGEFRKWYGNLELVVEWENDGRTLKNFPGAIIPSEDLYFLEAICWPRLGTGVPGFRLHPSGYIPGDLSPCFYSDVSTNQMLGILNSKAAHYFLQAINPTVTTPVGDMAKLPYIKPEQSSCLEENVKELVNIHKQDWDAIEISIDFSSNPFLVNAQIGRISNSWDEYIDRANRLINRAVHLEAQNNEIVLSAYGLQDSISADVEMSDITLMVNRHFMLENEDEVEKSKIDRSEVMQAVISYSIGCIMGRYSLDKQGLVYAGSCNIGFSELVGTGVYQSLPADDDGIIPLTDQEWFPDDATNRFREFVKVVWGEDHLNENLDFVAESLCLHAIKPPSKKGQSESSMDTIRRYLSTQFYKDHLKTYKKRPIYWLFSSGKQKAFECLVYLHRYNEGTLARMRTEYVIPLTAKMAAYAQKLENDKEASGSAAEVKRLEKEIAQLHKQQAELSEFDEKLRHYADQRISLDLDDGVKVNYGKFGDLLTEVKAITGKSPEVKI